jgi:hypothetical protein
MLTAKTHGCNLTAVKTLTPKRAKTPPVERRRLTRRALVALREADSPKTKWKSFDSVAELMADLEGHAKDFKKRAV